MQQIPVERLRGSSHMERATKLCNRMLAAQTETERRIYETDFNRVPFGIHPRYREAVVAAANHHRPIGARLDEEATQMLLKRPPKKSWFGWLRRFMQ